MSALVTPADVAARLGVDPYDGAELTQVTRFCTDVSALLRSRRPLLDEWVAEGLVATEVVVAVAVQVVARALTSAATGGVGLRSETFPEYQYELTASTSAGLNLSNRELALITPVSERNRPFSVTPSC